MDRFIVPINVLISFIFEVEVPPIFHISDFESSQEI